MSDAAAAGAFIVLEGPDGAGKTTQVRRLAERLAALGRRTVLVREPGGTPIGEVVRAVLLDPAHEAMDARAELFLYMASRAQLVRDVIRPALAEGHVVLADRFLASSAVYQGIAGGVGFETVLDVGLLATGGLRPDLVLLLDLDAERAHERVGLARERDRLERKPLEYHRRVVDGYRRYAEISGDRVERIDASRAVDDVSREIERAVLATLEPTGGPAPRVPEATLVPAPEPVPVPGRSPPAPSPSGLRA